MPIPELELARVKRALDKFCERIPMHVRQEPTNLYRLKGNSVVLIERRPYAGTWLTTPNTRAMLMVLPSNCRFGSGSGRM
jgi:hypothetical protein